MTFTTKTMYGNYPKCVLEKNNYVNNKHIAISIFSYVEGPIADMTVNIAGINAFPENFSCVDTNNCPWAETLIKKLGIGKPTNTYLNSGWCSYPVYEFYPEEIEDFSGR